MQPDYQRIFHSSYKHLYLNGLRDQYNKIVLVGGGGHCKACIDVIECEGFYRISGIVDLPDKVGSSVLDYRIVGSDSDLPELAKEYACFLITLGQIKTPRKRIETYSRLKEYGVTLPVIVSPIAHISRHAKIGDGTIVMHGAVVNAAAKIGANCIINSKSLVEHDAIIEDHCHISTGAIINGGSRIGRGSFLGSNSVIRDGIEIGPGAVIGAGATILRNVPATGGQESAT